MAGLAAATPARENCGTREDRETPSDAVSYAHQPRAVGVCLSRVGDAP